MLVRRLRSILVPRPAACDPLRKRIFEAELAALGYLLENPEQFNDSVLDGYAGLIAELRELRGGQVDYVPLFLGFPESVPEQAEYFLGRLRGDLPSEGFGANPVTQMQDPELFRPKVLPGDSHVEWIRLRLLTTEEAEESLLHYLRAQLYTPTSIPEFLRDDLGELLERFGVENVEAARVTFKETRAFLMRYAWDRLSAAGLEEYCDTPTDLLRMLGSDASLSGKTTYPRLSRPQRRLVLQCLELCTELEEDLFRYRGLWLALGRGLHPGAEPFPRVAAAFAQLRKGRRETFNARVERALLAGEVESTLPLLRTRPGLFARRLHQLLEHGSADAVLPAFAEVAGRVPLKTLLTLLPYFRTIETAFLRTVINKRGRIRVMPNRRHRLPAGVRARLLPLLARVVGERIASKFPSWEGKRVFIDPALAHYTVPLQLRKASEGLLVLGRGTRLPLDLGKVLRLFVWWKQTAKCTDLDLSLIQFGSELNYLGQVSFTRLASEGITHSGDLRNAPLGAAEFIDVNLATLRSLYPACRYLAPEIFHYGGERFGEMDCQAGWMIRQEVDSAYASFDIKTVQQKFLLTGSQSYCIPFLVDLWDSQIVYVDLYVGEVEQHARVEGAVRDIAVIVGELVEFTRTRLTMQELAELHCASRGGVLVDERSGADVTFGLTDCDYPADHLERCLAELL